METAEPPVAARFSAFRIHFIQTISSADCRPRRGGICLFRVICGLPRIRVHSCPFVVENQWLRPLQQEQILLHMNVSFTEIATAAERIVVR